MRTSVEQPDYFRFLMATWNAKIFSHHKKSKGVVDGECETIMLADESEQIACDMEDFCFEAESGAMPVNINATDVSQSLDLSPIICAYSNFLEW